MAPCPSTSRDINVRIKKYGLYTRLEVFWMDIVERSGWTALDAAQKSGGAKCKNVGYFLSNHKKMLNIASSVSEDNDCNVTSIPWSVIYKIDVLRSDDGEYKE